MITLKELNKAINNLRLVGMFPKKTLQYGVQYKFNIDGIDYYYVHLTAHMSYHMKTSNSIIAPWIGCFLSDKKIINIERIKHTTKLVSDSVVTTEELIPVYLETKELDIISDYFNDVEDLFKSDSSNTYRYAIPLNRYENLNKITIVNHNESCYLCLNEKMEKSYCILNSKYIDGIVYTNVRNYAHKILSQVNNTVNQHLNKQSIEDKSLIINSFNTLKYNLKCTQPSEENKILIRENLNFLLIDKQIWL